MLTQTIALRKVTHLDVSKCCFHTGWQTKQKAAMVSAWGFLLNGCFLLCGTTFGIGLKGSRYQSTHFMTSIWRQTQIGNSSTNCLDENSFGRASRAHHRERACDALVAEARILRERLFPVSLQVRTVMLGFGRQVGFLKTRSSKIGSPEVGQNPGTGWVFLVLCLSTTQNAFWLLQRNTDPSLPKGCAKLRIGRTHTGVLGQYGSGFI